MAGLPQLAKDTVTRVNCVPNGHTHMLPIKMARLGRFARQDSGRPVARVTGPDQERNCWWHWPQVPMRAWAEAV